MSYTASQIADWLLSKLSTEAGDTISPLKLQKLVYYAQAWHLTIFNNPLFDEKIEAWAHGPVIPSLYQRFKETCRDCAIETEKAILEKVEFPSGTARLLNEVYSIYGEHSASYLEALTHSEAPWIEARKGLPPHERSNNEITHESMKAYYSGIKDGK